MRLARELMGLGEAIHGGDVERKILERLSKVFTDAKKVEVKTKFWEIRREEVYLNGERVRGALMPYTSGCVKGKVGKEIKVVRIPSHPFELSQPEGYEGLVIVDSNLRRISLLKPSPVAFFVDREVEGYVELCGEAELRETTSYNLETTLKEGEDYIVVGAHVDHWLTGFHDNLFSVELALSLRPRLRNHGFKLVFFSSEEGPKCCTGSLQHPKEDTFAMISLDALFPDRVVFSSTPDLWELSSFFKVKRVEMPTPFSDHFPYVMEGHPAMVLYNDDLIPLYHSDADLPVEGDEEYFLKLKASLERAIEFLDSRDREYLDRKFFLYSGLKERKGAIVPKGLTSVFKRA
ncbi:MAG: peptidase M28 [Candidatus Aramenus sulfurataquae]|uniref:Peptidase M28 n=3 Tax=Candidatus Aramenus sulfurataquae TaxID=1326980 RepID=W7KKF7_9CREN|nr:MAG: peptidase M28 [Candidatus Aramenus sulfurataquae]MCL7344148.1 Zn-dependent exopeptidase M28 [Candidatus Aramenus sulfurataquae]